MKFYFATNRNFTAVSLILLIIFMGNPASSWTNDRQFQKEEDATFLELFLIIIDDIAPGINNQLPDIDEFKEQVKEFKEGMDNKRSAILDEMAGIIKKYADNENGLSGAGNIMIEDFRFFSEKLWAMLSEFPRWFEVKEIAEPIVDDFVDDVKEELPEVRRGSPNNNPMGTVINFYDDMARETPLNTGELFKLEPLVLETTSISLVEVSQEQTKDQTKSTDILYREKSKYRNSDLVFYELIIDNDIGEKFEELKDWSVYHGAFRKLKENAANSDLAKFVGENINIFHYHIHKAVEEDLIADVDYSQLGGS
ncbi:MAG: hypothetical protein KAS66_08395, partial [Candidatus Omnitrophica bacterium]|nr:hypothetical protein [Candidatus Omnitrophota bacterium]